MSYEVVSEVSSEEEGQNICSVLINKFPYINYFLLIGLATSDKRRTCLLYDRESHVVFYETGEKMPNPPPQFFELKLFADGIIEGIKLFQGV